MQPIPQHMHVHHLFPCCQHKILPSHTASQALPTGSLKLLMPDGAQRDVRIERAHMEEDAGKSSHAGGGASTVDYNRAGMSLSRAPALHTSLWNHLQVHTMMGLWPSPAAGLVSLGYRGKVLLHQPAPFTCKELHTQQDPVSLQRHCLAGICSHIGSGLTTLTLQSKPFTQVPL